jgi:ferric-dicitrate binding protein FerR (iron transport regulator)
MLGEKDKAKEAFQAFLDRDPLDARAIQEAERYLTELK